MGRRIWRLIREPEYLRFFVWFYSESVRENCDLYPRTASLAFDGKGRYSLRMQGNPSLNLSGGDFLFRNSLKRETAGNQQVLEKTYRRRFPFRLATTSYIYPDFICENASALAPYIDELELLLFESANLPQDKEIARLEEIQCQTGLLYNVHLPLDIDLGNSCADKRRAGVKAVLRAIALTERLNPTTFTIHLPFPAGKENPCPKSAFSKSIEAILESKVGPDRISVETLDYPLHWISDILDSFGLSVCLDVGHILLMNESPVAYAETYLERTAVVHLHGNEEGRDHQSLSTLDRQFLLDFLKKLESFTGTVSLEVFSFENLRSSLETLEEIWSAKGD